MTKSREVLILLDADVVIHLYKAERISLLKELYGNRLRMLDIVLNELKRNPTIRDTVDNLFLFKVVDEIQFPTTSQPEMFREFMEMTKQGKGPGESASLLYCKHHQHIIASSNTKDIKEYCKENDIAYLTTLDILSVAVYRKSLSVVEANQAIKDIISNKSMLSCHDIEEYMQKWFDRVKLNY